MKILVLTQVLPYPPDSGPKVKTWNVIKYLSRQHEVTLISFVRGNQDAEVDKLKSYCREVYTIPIKRGILKDVAAMVTSLMTGQPWIMVRDRRKAMFDLVDNLTYQTAYDFAMADQLNMAQYAQAVHGVKKILDAHNPLWLLYKRLAEKLPFGPMKWLYERDWRLLKGYEGRICREFDAVTAVSQEDRAALEEAAGQINHLVVAPITVDTGEVTAITRVQGADHILHIGTMFWGPNVDGILWFARDIYPLIKSARPKLVFDIVGLRPPQSVRDLAVQDPSINVTGYVSDPEDYLKQAGVMVVPLRAGGGMRVKILNAMAQGLPIVTTSLGCEGIAVVNGRDALIADTPQEFASAVLKLLADPELADQLGRNGRQLIETTYNYLIACKPLDPIFNT